MTAIMDDARGGRHRGLTKPDSLSRWRSFVEPVPGASELFGSDELGDPLCRRCFSLRRALAQDSGIGPARRNGQVGPMDDHAQEAGMLLERKQAVIYGGGGNVGGAVARGLCP
jgi:hypothetical protein